MGIFVFPPHAKIPLHDHPGMCVLSRVIYGDLQRLSLDLPRHPNPPRRSWLPWSQSRTAATTTTNNSGGTTQQPPERLAYKNHVDRLQAPDCSVLYPFEGNLHEFVAGPHGAALLDVLLPPYDLDQNRDCTFYYIRDLSHSEQQEQLLMLENSSGHDNNEEEEDPDAAASGEKKEKRSPCWIVPTGQPEDFHCISGMYRDLGEC